MTSLETFTPFPDTKALDFKNTLTQDAFEWKFPSRNETMYLSTIKPPDIGNNNYGMNRQSRSLYTADIVGNKRHFTRETMNNLKNDDIDMSQPKKLCQPLNKAYYYLRNDDIDGSRPCMNYFKTTRAPSNPLAPTYKLAGYEELEPFVPKFLQDSYNINDIDGARPKRIMGVIGGLRNYMDRQRKEDQTSEVVLRTKKRDINDITDIEGTRPKKEKLRTTPINHLEVKDINEFNMYKTGRVTNPLEPEYKVQGELPKTVEIIGKVQGSHSKLLHPYMARKTVGFNLNNTDIYGSIPGTTGNKYIKKKERLEFRDINQTQDIPGAQKSTLLKGISTLRHLNPLTPDYKYPGHLQDQEYIKSLYDPHYVREEKPKSRSKSIRLIGQGSNENKYQHIDQKHSTSDQPPINQSVIPQPDYRFESMVQQMPITESNKLVADQPQNQSSKKSNASSHKDAILAINSGKTHDKNSNSQHSNYSAKSHNSGVIEKAESIKTIGSGAGRSFQIKTQPGILPLHKLDRANLEIDRYKFYGVAKFSSGGQPGDDNLREHASSMNNHNEKMRLLETHQDSIRKITQPKKTKLEQFDRFAQSDWNSNANQNPANKTSI